MSGFRSSGFRDGVLLRGVAGPGRLHRARVRVQRRKVRMAARNIRRANRSARDGQVAAQFADEVAVVGDEAGVHADEAAVFHDAGGVDGGLEGRSRVPIRPLCGSCAAKTQRQVFAAGIVVMPRECQS